MSIPAFHLKFKVEINCFCTINRVYFSTPFQAIITPLSVHNFGGGLTKVYPNLSQTILKAVAIKLLHAAPPETT